MNVSNNTIINLSLGLAIVISAALGYFVYTNWQQSTPPVYTPVESIDQARLAVQLKDHLDAGLYDKLGAAISDTLIEDIGYVTIREGSYGTSDNGFTFLSDISGTSATYRFEINTDEGIVEIGCANPRDNRDQAWSCQITPTGDGHVH